MSVESILRKKGADVATIAPDVSVKRAADWLHAKNIGSLVVTSGGAILGLVSEREIVHAIARYGDDHDIDTCERDHATRRDHRFADRNRFSR